VRDPNSHLRTPEKHGRPPERVLSSISSPENCKNGSSDIQEKNAYIIYNRQKLACET